MLVADFDFELPERLIAQEPARQRDAARLLVVNRASGAFTDAVFSQLPEFLRTGDLLVVNNTRVFPARLVGRRLNESQSGDPAHGAKVEVFLVRELAPLVWETLVKPGKAMREGARVEFEKGALSAEVIERRDYGRRILRFSAAGDFHQLVDRLGQTPLPPYIRRERRLPQADAHSNPQATEDAERYQTIFASERGAIAAPTAGLHFTPELFATLQRRGVSRAEITLHVGYGTFQPVKVERVEDHRVESEFYSINAAAAEQINAAMHSDRRIIAVGTTTTRALESAARRGSGVRGQGSGIEDRGQGTEDRGQCVASSEQITSGKVIEDIEQKMSSREPVQQAETRQQQREQARQAEMRQRQSAATEQESGVPVSSSPPHLFTSSSPSLFTSSSRHPRTPHAARPTPDASPVQPVACEATDLFIYPGFAFQVLGGLVTNFHLPKSSLLMLVSAFAGRELMLEAYRHAVKNEYRFYSYGDAMLIL